MTLTNQIQIFQSNDGDIQLEVILEQETGWLSQRQIAELFGTKVPAISKHISNIVNEGELNDTATVSKMEIVQVEGKRKVKRNVDVFNLDMIISNGYRVNSLRMTQ